MNYQEYLKSAHWLAFRKSVLNYWGNRCAVCYTAKGPIETHHRTYERLGFELFTDVIPLCSDCHDKLLAPQQEQHDKLVKDAILSMYAGMVWNG